MAENNYLAAEQDIKDIINIFNTALNKTDFVERDTELSTYDGLVTVGSLPFPHVTAGGNGACYLDGYIYIFGSASSTYYKTAYKYSIANKTWTQLTDIPYNFYNGSVVAVGSFIYLFGGDGANTTAYRYYPAKDTWTQLTTIPFSFTYGQAVVESDKDTIHLMCGSYHYTYSISSNSYTQQSNMPHSYFNYFAAVITDDDDIYALGGSSSSYYARVYKLSKGSTTWNLLSTCSYYMQYMQAYLRNNKIYVYGGNGYTQYLRIYDIETGLWEYNTSATQSRDLSYYSLADAAAHTNKGAYILGSTSSNFQYGLYLVKRERKLVFKQDDKVATESSVFYYYNSKGNKVSVSKTDDFYVIPQDGIYYVDPDAKVVVIA
jgi:hypothetical protein